MPIYQYKCSCCDVTIEDLRKIVEREDTTICPSCGQDMVYLVSTPSIKLDGCDPGYPTAYAKWEKMQKSKLAAERKREG
jgi:putative FmdB family regulatory protein